MNPIVAALLGFVVGLVSGCLGMLLALAEQYAREDRPRVYPPRQPRERRLDRPACVHRAPRRRQG